VTRRQLSRLLCVVVVGRGGSLTLVHLWFTGLLVAPGNVTVGP